MTHRIRATALAAAGFAAMAAIVGSGTATAQEHTAAADLLTIDEWTVPYDESRPRDPFVAPDGRVWFVGQAAHYAAVFDPASGEFKRYDMEDGTGPHNLIVDEDGMVYYAGNRANHIGIIDPATGEIDKIMMPDERARDPHTLIWDDNGDIWFSVQGGNLIGFLDKESRDVRLVEAPEVETRRGLGSSRPYGVKLDSENRPWIAHFNTNLIGMVEPASFELIGYDLPEGSRPRRLVIDSKDRIWYVDYSRGKIGLVVEGGGFQREYDLPAGAESRPYGVAIDKYDRVWLVETGIQPNRFVGFDTETEEFLGMLDVPSGGGTIRHMYYDPDTDSIWFGTDVNTVGRAVVSPRSR
ncbi:virginiamycin B lyase family protein [Candidatus Palauibacter sp.]|uniref:Vgb family protein n=1 Tax=Candidatus Palauibacter sp. TaxID=3101350 RepID=UPI003B5AD9AC